MIGQVSPSAEIRPDDQTMEEVMSQYQAALLRYATRVLNNADAAQDVVQDTFIRFHSNWSRITQRGLPVKGWLFRTAHNAAVDLIRKESRLRFLHERKGQEPEPPDPFDEERQREREERHALVMEHLEALRPKEREVLVLRLQEEMSYKEIAGVINRSEGYVGSLIHTATKKLTQSLRHAGVIS
ncbi:MAG: RNA polymerase sigma factor [Pontiellaceae bacterium]|nr:RNA polymerase sigma factor [Pontiellaceae bacterium]MBN2784695.1 RNA polymerase sigma factor [Pontiellaceae bacterium]